MSKDMSPYYEFKHSTYQQILKKERPKKFREYQRGRKELRYFRTCLDYEHRDPELIMAGINRSRAKGREYQKRYKDKKRARQGKAILSFRPTVV